MKFGTVKQLIISDSLLFSEFCFSSNLNVYRDKVEEFSDELQAKNFQTNKVKRRPLDILLKIQTKSRSTFRFDEKNSLFHDGA